MRVQKWGFDSPLPHQTYIEKSEDIMDKTAPYGYCPICGAPGFMRERRPNGNDMCENKHEYPSKIAVPEKLKELQQNGENQGE